MKKSGLTFTELMVPIAITGMIAAIAVPAFLDYKARVEVANIRESCPLLAPGVSVTTSEGTPAAVRSSVWKHEIKTTKDRQQYRRNLCEQRVTVVYQKGGGLETLDSSQLRFQP